MTCIRGREVVIRLREKFSSSERTESVVCPGNWTKSKLLSYVRSVHKDETVRIVDWKPVTKEDSSWATRLWIVNPKEMV